MAEEYDGGPELSSKSLSVWLDVSLHWLVVDGTATSIHNNN